MLTYNQYCQLGQDAQVKLLWQEGYLLRSLEAYGYKFSLFCLEGFYVEVQYYPDENRIEQIRPFQHLAGLHPYLGSGDSRWALA